MSKWKKYISVPLLELEALRNLETQAWEFLEHCEHDDDGTYFLKLRDAMDRLELVRKEP